MSIKQVKAVCCDKCEKPIFNKGILVQSGNVKFTEYSKDSGNEDKIYVDDVTLSKVYCSRACMVSTPQEITISRE